jgi:hypothetical protein
MKSIPLITRSLFAVLALISASGCTSVKTYSGSVQPTTFPGGRVLPHHVALVINQELTNYQYSKSAFLGNFLLVSAFPLGKILQDCAQQTASKTFQQVDVVPSIEKATAVTSADMILIPRAVNSAFSEPVYGTQNDVMTLVVEWTAKDRASQNILWVKTITANGLETKWNVNMHSGGKLVQHLFDDLSLKTYNAFQEAPELSGSQP